METLDTSYHKRRMTKRMQDPAFRREYEAARREIDQVDAVMRALDELRIAAGLPKSELAHRIGKEPAAVRRLFTAQVNPELKTVAALAEALDADIRIIPRNAAKSAEATPRVHTRRQPARQESCVG